MTTARAVRWHAAGDVRLETVDIAPPGDGEVWVAVAYCGVCGSDLHEIADGPHAIPVDTAPALSGTMAPITLGREFSGTVVAGGSGEDELPRGARVPVAPNYRSGRCPPSAEGRSGGGRGTGFRGAMGSGGVSKGDVMGWKWASR